MARRSFPPSSLLVLACVACTASAACGQGGSVPRGPAADDDAARAEAIAGDPGAEAEAFGEDGGGDVTADVPGDGDADDDGVADADGEVEPACAGPLAAPGCPCGTADECASGYCIWTSKGRVCGKSCSAGEECGPGEACVQVASYPDVFFLCIDLHPTICRPCESDADCRVDFAPVQPRCLPLGQAGEGSWCFPACASGSDCPDGYGCLTEPGGVGVPGGGGRAAAKACLPESDACECSPLAIQQAARTGCLVSNDLGACPGVRRCREDGLSGCDGPAAQADDCNGKDDDCDGATDEHFVPSPCAGACGGTTACEGGEVVCKGVPGRDEVCNGQDDDCNGVTDDGFPDTDGDGIADCVDPDADGDGVPNEDDACPLTYDPAQTDTDGDGLGDACDDDADGDGVPNEDDACPLTYDPAQTDTDGDGLGDACDDDADGDGVLNAVDNCPLSPNTKQDDADKDGLGDACDCDIDGDGVSDATIGCPDPGPAADNCPLVPNHDQSDIDGDGIGDPCDADADGDGVLNVYDNCSLHPNPGQEDNDKDKAGDACDEDDDNDGVPDEVDLCPLVPDPDQSDLDGDGTGDACDPDKDGDGVANGADNCPGTPNPGQEDTNGDGIGDACEHDWDGDGVPNGDDVCPRVFDPAQADLDQDTVGDACDCDIDGDGVANPNPDCPAPPKADLCPFVPDPGQADFDGDGRGDACDDDDDGDGEADATDCAPLDPAIRHGAQEACNGRDDDCDGATDEGPAAGCVVFFLDHDGDGFGVAGTAACRCGPDGEYRAPVPGDCDDGDAAVKPGGVEACGGGDEDCDGLADEAGAAGCAQWFYDGDGDGHGNPAGGGRCLCGPLAPWSAPVADDCDDTDGTSWPGAPEHCDGADDDCDGKTDEPGAAGCQTLYADVDLDGYGDANDHACLCSKLGIYTTATGGDCDDSDAGAHPGVAESCDGRDEDCNGQTDEGSAAGCSTWYRDGDGDGHGKPGDSVCRCGPVAPYTAATSFDCNDAGAGVNPDAPEACNGYDDDCDTYVDEGAGFGCSMWYLDADSDGWGAPGGVCACFATPPYQVGTGGDCDDVRAFVSPGATEACDGLDDDCDGTIDEEGAAGCFGYWRDADGDGWGALGSRRCLCAPEGEWQVWSGGDCDDADAGAWPGAPSACSDAAQCCAPATVCLAGACATGAMSCSIDEDCPSDTRCVATKCTPWGPGEADAACTRPTVVGIFRPALQCKWEAPPAGDPKPTANNVIPTPVVADFNLDGDAKTVRPSIVFPTNAGSQCDDPNDFRNGWVRVIDGDTCAQQHVITAHEVVAAAPLAIGDIDLAADGRPEIVANAAGGGLVAFKFNAATGAWGLLWRSRNANGTPSTWAASIYRWTGPTIADVDGDGLPEVAMGPILHDLTGLVIASNLGWKSPNSTGQIAVLADVDADGKAEMVTGDGVWRFQAGTGWVKESYFTATVSDGFVALADFGNWTVAGLGTAAGLPEVVVISGGTARIQTLSGQVVFGPFDLPFFPPATGKGHGGPPTVGDFDGDGKPEFAMAGTGSYTIFDRDCDATPVPYGCHARGILWSTPTKDYSSSMTGSSVFDFEGDGRAEAIYADECFARVYSGNTGEVLFSQARTSGTWYENPVVADTDGDFRTEVVVGTNINCGVSCPPMDPYFRGLKCAADADCPTGAAGSCKAGYCRCTTDAGCGSDGVFGCADPLPNTPGIGKVCRTKHYGQKAGVYVFRDVGDAWVASRPIWNQHAYSVTNVEDDGGIPAAGAVQANWKVAGLNNFRQNVQGALQPTLAANLTARIGTIGNCDPTGALSVPGIVCNRGAAPVARGLAVAFTSGPPDTGEVECLKKTTLDLFPGDCESFSCTYHPATAFAVGLYADYGGSGGKGDATECREDDNTATRAGVTCRNVE
ncbi:MAG: thrombospondin type 3 repeat-containing protein [Deltaproteobacteria bacterium]|nr:thrombospondin type 3 repeat-containing protein [Deltaproteobacteria bacterium]